MALRWAAVVLVGVLGVVGCSSPVRQYRCSPQEAARGPDPAELWKCNRNVIVRVLKDRSFSMGEYHEAARFFEELTGLPADSLETPLGEVPGSALDESLERWDHWCEANCDRLEWDPRIGRLHVSSGDSVEPDR